MFMELVTAAAASRITAATGSFEGMAATTARNSIGIIHGKASSHQTIYIVHFAAADITNAHLIHQHSEVPLRDDGVAVLLLVKGHTILQTRATAARDEDTQRKTGIVFLS